MVPKITAKPIVYLAVPYTHKDTAIMQKRFELVTEFAANLMNQGYIVYSPITSSHPVDYYLRKEGINLSSDQWVDFDESFLAVCTSCILLMLPGWEKSSGVKRELDYFKGVGKTILHVLPSEAFGYHRWQKEQESVIGSV